MACTLCQMGYFEQKQPLSGLSPTTYGAIATSQYDSSNGMKLDWQRILESAITGVMVAVISTYMLKTIKDK